MASGKQHQTINVTVFVVASAAAAYALHQGWGSPWTDRIGLEWPAVIAFTGAFLFGTFLVTPDLDLAEQHVLAKRNWGRLGVLWVPYGYLFAHRGLSHGWFFGPLTRLIYLALIAALLVAGAYGGAQALDYPVPPLSWPTRVEPERLWPLGAAAAGFYVSQWLHLLADGVGPLHGLRRLAGKLVGR